MVSCGVTVAIVINDEDVITRCTANTNGWRDDYYPLATPDDVLGHLAFNAIANGVDRVNRLDGWADLPDDACTMRVVRDIDVDLIVVSPA